MDLSKKNDRGGQWNPTPPLAGVTPVLAPPTGAKEQFFNAVEWMNFREAAVRDDSIPEDKWFTAEDTEWPFELASRIEGIDPDPGPILRKWITFTREVYQCTRIEAGAQIVGMDSAWQLAHETTQWAHSAPGVSLAKDVRRVDNDIDDDIITWQFTLGVRMTHRIDEAMDVNFAEKFHWQKWRAALDDGDDDGLYGWRLEKVIEHLTGVDCAVTTTYGKAGSPAMDNYPQGHAFFWVLMMLRASLMLNGRGVDRVLRLTGRWGGLLRMVASVHDEASMWAGDELAMAMLDDDSPIWAAVDAAKASGWPKV